MILALFNVFFHFFPWQPNEQTTEPKMTYRDFSFREIPTSASPNSQFLSYKDLHMANHLLELKFDEWNTRPRSPCSEGREELQKKWWLNFKRNDNKSERRFCHPKELESSRTPWSCCSHSHYQTGWKFGNGLLQMLHGPREFQGSDWVALNELS